MALLHKISFVLTLITFLDVQKASMTTLSESINSDIETTITQNNPTIPSDTRIDDTTSTSSSTEKTPVTNSSEKTASEATSDTGSTDTVTGATTLSSDTGSADTVTSATTSSSDPGSTDTLTDATNSSSDPGSTDTVTGATTLSSDTGSIDTVTGATISSSDTGSTDTITVAMTSSSDTGSTDTLTDATTSSSDTGSSDTVTDATASSSDLVSTDMVTDATTSSSDTGSTDTVTDATTSSSDPVSTDTVTDATTSSSDPVSTDTVTDATTSSSDTGSTNTVTNATTSSSDTGSTNTVTDPTTSSSDPVSTDTTTVRISSETTSSATTPNFLTDSTEMTTNIDSNDNTTTTARTTTSNRETITINTDRFTIAVALSISIEGTFHPDLDDPLSSKYKQLKEKFNQSLHSAFTKMEAYKSIAIHRFRNGSTVCEFELLLKGDTNLTRTTYDFESALKTLNTTEVNGAKIVAQSIREMQAKFNKASQTQESGNACEIYNDIAYCQLGYSCSIKRSGSMQCTHVCKTETGFCYNGGVCFFDHLKEEPGCRCIDQTDSIYTGQRCETKTEKLALSSKEIIAITSSVGGVIIVAMGIALVFMVIKRNRSIRRYKNDSISVSGINLERFEDPDIGKRFRSGFIHGNNEDVVNGQEKFINGRQHKILTDTDGTETYFYQPMTQPSVFSEYESFQTSPIANTCFPSTFEIKRPSIRQGYTQQF